MRNFYKKMLAAVLAVAISIPAGVSVFAATEKNYSLNMQTGKFQIMNGTRAYRTYKVENTDLRLMRSTRDNFLAGVTRENDDDLTNITISNQKSITLNGSYNNLVLAASLTSDRSVVVDAKVSTLTVDCYAPVTISASADIAKLNVTNPYSVVTVENGADITKSYAVQGASVTGVSSAALTDKRADSLVSSTKIPTYVDVDERDEIRYTRNWSFDGTTFEVEVQSGVPLKNSVRDVIWTVRTSDNSDKKVSGSWNWVSPADPDEQISGKYTYRFTPTNTDLYPITNITVDYTAAESKERGISKPGISFEDSAHGPAGYVDIEISYPNNVEDDDTLYIYVDGEIVDEYSLSRSDAGDDDSFKVYVEGENGDRIKIKAKIKRLTGSSATSSTITYEIYEK